jgi:hypothetical protein
MVLYLRALELDDGAGDHNNPLAGVVKSCLIFDSDMGEGKTTHDMVAF